MFRQENRLKRSSNKWKAMPKKPGVALILALFTMLFISLLVVVFLDAAGIDQQITTNYIRTLQAEFIADAGVETAVYELKQSSSYTGTSGNVTFPAGSGNTYNVVVSGSNITSIGTVKGFSRTLTASFTISGTDVRISSWK